MKKNLHTMLAAAAGHVPDALMLAGAGAVSYGAWLLHPAAGWIVGGVLALVAGVLVAVAQRKAAA